MNQIEFTQYYWGPYILSAVVDDEFIDELLMKGEECREKSKLDARPYLAATIGRAFYYDNWEDWFLPRISPYIDGYLRGVSNYRKNAFNYLLPEHERGSIYPNVASGIQKDLSVSWRVDKGWINYQESFEYNPPHTHSGSMSFVIYAKVPKEIEEENERMHGIHNNSGPGMINFEYGEDAPFSLAKIHKLPSVGEIFIFPYWLRHYVFGFSSDVERVSVSGNVTVEASIRDNSQNTGTMRVPD